MTRSPSAPPAITDAATAVAIADDLDAFLEAMAAAPAPAPEDDFVHALERRLLARFEHRPSAAASRPLTAPSRMHLAPQSWAASAV